MNHAAKFFLGLVFTSTVAIGGCELIAAVDHDKIMGAGGSTSSSTSTSTTTTSSVTTTTTSTSTGCATEGEKSCMLVSDCTATTSDCTTPTCALGCCGTENKGINAPCSTNGTVCDGNGNCVACNMPTDCTAQTTLCKSDTCTTNKCGTANSTNTTTCNDNGGRICDGGGTCVQCNGLGDCPAQTTVCKTNTCTGNMCGTTPAMKGTLCTDNGGVVCDGNGTCVAMHCNDGIADADETDQDCGGASCGQCGDGLKCKVGTDCTSGVCDGTMHCATPTCSDGVKNGNETDKDCGGAGFMGAAACSPCADKLHCAMNTDCANNFCFGSGATAVCASCIDGVQDANETGLDCGGLQCDAAGKTCAVGLGCSVGADCASGFCDATHHCALEPDGSSCTSPTQCANGSCVGDPGSQVCCNHVCGGTCQACTMAKTGQPDGTCGSVTPGLAAPTGQCTAATPCGNTGNCASGGVCEVTANGTPLGSQVPGDCKKATCDGAGGTTTVTDPTDLPTPNTICETNPSCQGSTPHFDPAPTDTNCTADNNPPNHVCGDNSTGLAGTCVECNTSADCLVLNDAGTLSCDTATGTCQ